MNDRVFRDAMGKFATGITIVTTEYKQEIVGMTVNAFMSVSLDPKLIAVSIGDAASMYDTLQKTNKFGVSILTEDQKEISMFFAKQTKEDPNINYITQNEVPVIKNSLVTISCKVKDMVKAGDHMIFIAEVTDLTINEGKPILYASGDYCTLQQSE